MHVVAAVTTVFNRPSLLDHPCIEIGGPLPATSKDATVAFGPQVLVSHGISPDPVGQYQRGFLTASPRCPIKFECLPALRSVDSVQSDALAVDLDAVAVGNLFHPNDVWLRGRGRNTQKLKSEDREYGCPFLAGEPRAAPEPIHGRRPVATEGRGYYSAVRGRLRLSLY